MIKTAATLVLIVSTSTCSLENVDGAQVFRFEMQTVEECQSAAEILDSRRNIRAYCE